MSNCILLYCIILSGLVAGLQSQSQSVEEIGARIIGGNAVLARSLFYYQVSIRIRNDTNVNGTHICGGGIISSNHVVTAAHCIQGETNHNASDFVLVAGDLNLQAPSINSVRRNVSNIYLHPDYNFTGLQNNIAILEIDEPFDSNSFISPLELTNERPAVGTECIISGWGSTSVSVIQNSDHLQYTAVNVQNQTACQEFYQFAEVDIADSVICTASNLGSSPCLGDEGGPLVSSRLLVGVFSFPGMCQNPVLYSDVSHYHSWITGIIESNAHVFYVSKLILFLIATVHFVFK